MNKRALNIQFLLADRARSKVNLASSRLISFYQTEEGLKPRSLGRLC